MISQTLKPKEIEYLKYLKGKGFDAETSYKRLENARNKGLFGEQQPTQEQPTQQTQVDYNQTIEQEPKNKTFLSRLQEAGQETERRQREIETSDRNIFRKTFIDKPAMQARAFSDIVGAGVAEGFETVGQAIKAITPDSVEKQIKDKVVSFINSDYGQSLLKTSPLVLEKPAKAIYNILPKDIQKDVEGLGNIGMGILDAVGVAETPRLIKTLGKGAISKGEKAIEATKRAKGSLLDTIKNKAQEIEGRIIKGPTQTIGKVGEGVIEKPYIPKPKIKKDKLAKGREYLFEAVNPTRKETKAVLKKRVDDLIPYIDTKKPLSNTLENVKSRIDKKQTQALEDMIKYEKKVGVKGELDTGKVIDKLRNKYQRKIGKSYIDADEARIAQQLIDTLKGFGKKVKDKDIITIRRAFDKIEKKNKGFMMSAESTAKGDIFGTANKFFREEIKKSNPKYAKHLEDYHKSTTIGDVIQATIDRRVGQQKGGFIRRGLETGTRVLGAGTGGVPGYVASEALIQGAKLLSSPAIKLTRGARLIKKAKGTILKSKKAKYGVDYNVSDKFINNSSRRKTAKSKKVSSDIKFSVTTSKSKSNIKAIKKKLKPTKTKPEAKPTKPVKKPIKKQIKKPETKAIEKKISTKKQQLKKDVVKKIVSKKYDVTKKSRAELERMVKGQNERLIEKKAELKKLEKIGKTPKTVLEQKRGLIKSIETNKKYLEGLIKNKKVGKKKAIDNKGGYIDPKAIIEDLKKLTPSNINRTAITLSRKLNLPNKVKEIKDIIKTYIKKYGEKIKDKLGDLADEIADKIGARSKFIDNRGWIDEEILNYKTGKYEYKSAKTIKEDINKLEKLKKDLEKVGGEYKEGIEFGKMSKKYQSLYKDFSGLLKRVKRGSGNVSVMHLRGIQNRARKMGIQILEKKSWNGYGYKIDDKYISKKDFNKLKKALVKELDEISTKEEAKIIRRQGKSAEEVTFEKIKKEYKKNPEKVLGEALYNLNKEAKKIRDKRTLLKEKIFEGRVQYSKRQREQAHEKLSSLYDDIQELYNDKDKYLKKIVKKFNIKSKGYHEFPDGNYDYYEVGGHGFHIPENTTKNKLGEIIGEISSEKVGKKISLDNVYKILKLIEKEANIKDLKQASKTK